MKPINIRLYTYTDKETGCKVVKAVTNYLGQTLFATAKCDPEDEFNQEFGEKLATTRINIKVAKLRAAIARDRAAWTEDYLNRLDNAQCRAEAAFEQELANIASREAELSVLKHAEEDLLASVN